LTSPESDRHRLAYLVFPEFFYQLSSRGYVYSAKSSDDVMVREPAATSISFDTCLP